MSDTEFNTEFFAQYSRVDLNQLLAAVNAELKMREARDIAAARDRIHAIAKEVGVPLSELLPTIKPASGKAKVAPRFRNPNNAAEVWTGRGRQPRWVIAALEAGATQDSLLIPATPTNNQAEGVQ